MNVGIVKLGFVTFSSAPVGASLRDSKQYYFPVVPAK